MAMTGRRTLAALVLLIGLHGFAVAQQSASVSATVRFVVLPLHTAASGSITPSAIPANETISAERISVGISSSSGLAPSRLLNAPGYPLIPPPRGSSVVVTITD